MAAGLGFKEFTTGDVLTAADANGYLASQGVMGFASAAARTSAIASPQEGMISYLKDTNSTEYYSGSAWVAIGGAASTAGLELITTNSFTTASAVNLNNIFTATYTNYKIIINANASSDVAFRWRLRASGTDNTSNNYMWGLLGTQFTGQSAYNESINGSLDSAFKTGAIGGTYRTILTMDVQNPQATDFTGYTGCQIYPASSTNAYAYFTTGMSSVTTSYDGMSFYGSSGTISGSYWIYGYKKA